MKKIIFTTVFSIVIIVVLAQGDKVPQAFAYQSVVLDKAGLAVSEKPVLVRISLLDGPSGPIVFSEEHNVTTSLEGVIGLAIGKGTVVSGEFGSVNWNGGNVYVKTEYDFKDGKGYSLSGISQLLSVPFALSAGNGSQWNTLMSDPNLLGIKYSDGKTGTYEFSNGDPTPGGVTVGLRIRNSKDVGGSRAFLNLETNGVTPSNNRASLQLKNPFMTYSLDLSDSSLYFIKYKTTASGISGGSIYIYDPKNGHVFNGMVRSTNGGFKFPDGSVQLTASTDNAKFTHLPANQSIYSLTQDDINNNQMILLEDGNWAGTLTLPSDGVEGQSLEVINNATFASAIAATNTNLGSPWNLGSHTGSARFRFLRGKWWFMGGQN